ncbi:hypothetical protein F5887DRAFT_938297 [Amanita rubescens]|nr:hypothetical protein F5887DRAFT_938297 [Amanita rubescens]
MPVAIYPVTNNPPPPPPPRSNLPLPLPLFILTIISLTFSWLLVVLSMLDLGYLSMWMNPTMSFLTRKKRTTKDPTYFSTIIVCAYLFGIVWFVAFIITNVILASNNDRFYNLGDVKKMGLPASVGSQRAQVIFALFETVVLEAFAIKGHLIIKETGDPEDWRPKVHQSTIIYILGLL